VSRLINIIVFVGMLSAYAFGVRAAPNQPPSPPAPVLPMLLTTVGQTQVILHDMQPSDHRLIFEIRSPDVTSMPSRSTLHLSFDARIDHVTEPSAPMPLRLETAVAGQQVTFFLVRDPFAFPQPWSYTVTIAFSRLPQTGTVTLGSLPPQNVTYPPPSPAVQVSVKTPPAT
jgi:hypothetical protein